MAIQRLTIDGYGQLEINNAAFRRDEVTSGMSS